MEIKDKELHRIVSTAIIYKDGRYLILRRGLEKKAFPGKWTVPGGGLEVDDYINTAKTTNDHWYFAVENSLRREIKEECNLEVGKVKYLCDMAFIRPDGVPVIILSFYCPYQSGEVILDSDNIDFAWVAPAGAENYDLVEGLLSEIKIVNKILKGGGKEKNMKNFNQEEFNNFIIENNVYGFFKEPITLKSGRLSHFYANWRNIVEDVWLTDVLADYLLAFVKDKGLAIETFYGVPDGATKLAIISQFKWAKRNDNFAKGSFVLAMGRKTPKDHGEAKDKFFVGAPRGKTIVIEDVTTSGGSLLETIDNLREAGTDISAVVSLTNRMEKGDDGLAVREAVEQKGIAYYQMSSALDILPSAYKILKPGREIGRLIENEFKEYGVKELNLGVWSIFEDFSDELNEKARFARSRVCLALDNLGSLEELSQRVEELSPLVGMFKIGKELFTKFGPEAIKVVQSYGANVFFDSKFYDIPHTVKEAAKAATQLGAAMFNVHCSGGLEMMKAAIEGAREASQRFNIAMPKIIGVTVLTSINQETMNQELGLSGEVGEQVLRLARLAYQAGLDGIVCSAEDLVRLKGEFPENFIFVTPGIRLAGADKQDQKRVLTPSGALRSGSCLLVVGRAITGYPTKEERLNAAYEILEDMTEGYEL